MKNFLFVLLALTLNTNAQTVSLLASGTKISFRGLSAVSEKIIWASGNNGTVIRSCDGGITWKWLTVKGFEKTDFRDIEAFDSTTAIIMSIAEPAYILKTMDGGETWKTVYENKTRGMFLDATDFRNTQNGIVVGDPVNYKFFIARTTDAGNTWFEIDKKCPIADSGEACFASSGTNIRMFKKNKTCFVSGGLSSRLFINNRTISMPILQGKESAGANSVALKNKKMFMMVGGDFNTPGSTFKNCVITHNKGRTWTQPAIAPHGYRSCVEYISESKWVTCGLNGVDYSMDDGKTWQWISKESFNVCRKAKYGNAVFLAGNGKIGRLSER